MGNTDSSANQETLVGSTILLRNGESCSVDRELAKGGFSTVCACTRRSDGKKIALKRIKTQSQESENEALGEIRAHSLLGNDHPCSVFIVPLLETHVHTSGKTNREFSLIFPLFTNGSLSDMLLSKTRIDPLDERNSLNLFLSCASAVRASHEKGVAHCDIKTLNFMLSDNAESCILIDFGSARGPPLKKRVDTKAQALVEQERAERFSSAAYRAPELWDVPHKGAELDYAKCDVFALGCVLYSMSFPPYGYSPFESPSHGIMALAARTASFSFPEDTMTDVRSGTKDLITDMLAINPVRRPTADEVVMRIESLLKEVSDEDFDVNFATPAPSTS